MHMELILVHIISKYPDKVCKASRTLYEIGGEIGWMTRKLHSLPRIFPDSLSCCQVWKNGSVCVCMCLGLGQMGARLRSDCLKWTEISKSKSGDAVYLPEHNECKSSNAADKAQCGSNSGQMWEYQDLRCFPPSFAAQFVVIRYQLPDLRNGCLLGGRKPLPFCQGASKTSGEFSSYRLPASRKMGVLWACEAKTWDFYVISCHFCVTAGSEHREERAASLASRGEEDVQLGA